MSSPEIPQTRIAHTVSLQLSPGLTVVFVPAFPEHLQTNASLLMEITESKVIVQLKFPNREHIFENAVTTKVKKEYSKVYFLSGSSS